jgi:hypothetical protein
MQSLVAFAAGKGVVAKDDELSRSRSEIELFMKALTARSLFGTNGYFRVINNTNDQIFAKALEVISTGL